MEDKLLETVYNVIDHTPKSRFNEDYIINRVSRRLTVDSSYARGRTLSESIVSLMEHYEVLRELTQKTVISAIANYVKDIAARGGNSLNHRLDVSKILSKAIDVGAGDNGGKVNIPYATPTQLIIKVFNYLMSDPDLPKFYGPAKLGLSNVPFIVFPSNNGDVCVPIGDTDYLESLRELAIKDNEPNIFDFLEKIYRIKAPTVEIPLARGPVEIKRYGIFSGSPSADAFARGYKNRDIVNLVDILCSDVYNSIRNYVNMDDSIKIEASRSLKNHIDTIRKNEKDLEKMKAGFKDEPEADKYDLSTAYMKKASVQNNLNSKTSDIKMNSIDQVYDEL